MNKNLTEHVQEMTNEFERVITDHKSWHTNLGVPNWDVIKSHLLLSQLKTIELVKEDIGNRASSFGNCIDPLDVVKSISHMIFKNPMQNSSDYQFLGKAQAYFEILTLLDTIIQDIKSQIK
jgi:hypothetical protein